MENKHIERMHETNGVLQRLVDTYRDDAYALLAQVDEEVIGDRQADVDVARRFELFEQYLEDQKAGYLRWADFWPKTVVATGEAIDTAQAKLQQLLDNHVASMTTSNIEAAADIIRQSANITVLHGLVEDMTSVREDYDNGFEAFLPAYVLEDVDVPELDGIMEPLAQHLSTWNDGITRSVARANDSERAVDGIRTELTRAFGGQ